jgi:chitin disaccharide deacetylase
VKRVLIVNADDFGRSRGVNGGVALAHDRGIVTSASAMVRWPAAEEAAAIAAERPELGVGLHVDLSEWAYLDGEWQAVYEVAPNDPAAVMAEIEVQVASFEALFGRAPTHLDSHQHVHRRDPARSALLLLGRALGIPVRECTPGIEYRGGFYGQTAKGEPLTDAISFESLLSLLRQLPAGVTELACHPSVEPEPESSYASERPRELNALCDPRLKAAIEAEGIQLGSFAGLGGGGGGPARF